MKERYISISGVGSVEDRLMVGKQAYLADVNEVVVGVQATTKTQSIGIKNRRGQAWHPVGDSIWPVFIKPDKISDEDLTNLARTKAVIHFSYAQPAPDTVEFQTLNMLRRAPQSSKLGFVGIRGWQFNNLDLVNEDYRRLFERLIPQLGGLVADTLIILQVSANVMNNVNDPAQFVRSISDLPVSHILLDTSGGSGTAFQPEQYKEWLEALRIEAPQLSPAIAGGLGPDSMESYRQLYADYPRLSCDAEARLRDISDGVPLDKSRLVPAKVGAFLTEYAHITSSND